MSGKPGEFFRDGSEMMVLGSGLILIESECEGAESERHLPERIKLQWKATSEVRKVVGMQRKAVSDLRKVEIHGRNGTDCEIMARNGSGKL